MEKYLIALQQEIDFNVESIRESIHQLPSLKEILDFVKISPGRRPVVTFSYIDFVFRSKIETLQVLDNVLIRQIIQFYAQLQEIKTDVMALESAGFATISDEGKAGILEDIKTDLLRGSDVGKAACNGIALYLKLQNRRHAAI